MRLRSFVALTCLAVPCAAQSPALIADADRTIAGSLGTEGKPFHIASAILGETRRINVALPASYGASAPSRRYPVAVVFDGEYNLPATAAAASELARRGQVPEMIIVAIANTNRLRDLTPPGLSVSGSSTKEGGDRFLDFIEKELLPAVDRQLRGAEPRIMLGHSSGGILTTYAAATRPAFRAFVSLDGPTHLGEGWLVRRMVAATTSRTAPLRYAAYGARFPWDGDAWNSLVAAAPGTWQLHHEKLPMESHESMVLLGTYLGLRQVFADYSMLAAPVAPTTSILPYYGKVGASLGAAVVPPKNLLDNVVEDLMMEGRGRDAHAAFDLMVASYGQPSNGKALRARIADVERKPPPTETVESLLATPFPTPEQAKDYLGEWVGDIWMNEDELTPTKPKHHLRLRVVDGRVEAEVENEPAPGVKQLSKITHLVITPAGLSYGFMNGMRPRGMLMHDGTRKGDTLSGVMRFGGINFTYPDGMTPPVFRFRFVKAK